MVRKFVIAYFVVGALFLGGVVILVVVLAGNLITGGSISSIGGTITNAGGIPDELVALITNSAKQAGCPEVTPALLAAQLHQESGFNPNATSPVGAEGIAQFMPATWAVVGHGGNVMDPNDAVPAAARYDCSLAQEISDIPGDAVENMLAAYNAGSGAVRMYAGIPPYLETQNYVRVITSQAAVYAQNLNGGGAVDAGRVAPVLAFMRAQLGKPYVWGATGPDSWDCSSLVQAAYATIGVHLDRTTFAQVNDGPHVSATNLQPGDLLFIAGSDGTDTAPGHVGMYMGNGEIIHAKGARWGVVDDALANWTDISIVVRPLAGTGA